MSLAHKGKKKSRDAVEKSLATRAGYRHSTETIEKMKEAQRKRWQNVV